MNSVVFQLSNTPVPQHSMIDMCIDCHKCIYYYVTWNPNFPHGCRAMGFKSRRYPINEVRVIMNGKDCLLFTARKDNKFRFAANITD